MPTQSKVIAFDVDPASLISLRHAFPGWKVKTVEGGAASALAQNGKLGTADLLVVGDRKDVAEVVGLCKGLRKQAGRSVTPLLVLVPPEQRALVSDALEAGADSCLVLPIYEMEAVGMLAHARAGNQPGRHTLDLDRAQQEDQWQDEGGEG